jgi:hypothetical protein
MIDRATDRVLALQSGFAETSIPHLPALGEVSLARVNSVVPLIGSPSALAPIPVESKSPIFGSSALRESIKPEKSYTYVAITQFTILGTGIWYSYRRGNFWHTMHSLATHT